MKIRTVTDHESRETYLSTSDLIIWLAGEKGYKGEREKLVDHLISQLRQIRDKHIETTR